jgi:hypothetical protein
MNGIAQNIKLRPLLLLLLYSMGMASVWFHGHEQQHTEHEAVLVQKLFCESSEPCSHQTHIQAKADDCDLCQLAQKFSQIEHRFHYFFESYCYTFQFIDLAPTIFETALFLLPNKGPPSL